MSLLARWKIEWWWLVCILWQTFSVSVVGQLLDGNMWVRSDKMLDIVFWQLLEVLVVSNMTTLFKRPPMRWAKSTKKENQCLSGQLITSVFFRIELGTYHKSSLRYFLLYSTGLRFVALMEAITRLVMIFMLQEVMLMMFDHNPEKKFYPKMYIL